MKHSHIFSNPKGIVSAFSTLDVVLKHGSDTRLKKRLLKLRSSCDRINSITASKLSR